MKNKQMLVIILIIFLLIFFLVEIEIEPSSEIAIFVIDTWQDNDLPFNNFYSNQLSHGTGIRQIIDRETANIEVDIINLEVGIEDKINQQLYFSQLERVLLYQRANPGHQVLVNISLAFYNYDIDHHRLIKKLKEAGVVVIAAAGNNDSSEAVYPAGFEESIAVAAANSKAKESYSNYGDYIDLAANGLLNLSFFRFNLGNLVYSNYHSSGTSLAAPRVTGLLARVLAYQSNLNVEEGIDIIKSNTVEIGDDFFQEGLLGSGLISKRRVLLSLDSLYFFKSPQILQILVLMSGLIYLTFSRYKLLSFFILILIYLVALPILFLLKEFISFLGGYSNNQEIIYFTIFLLLPFLFIFLIDFVRYYRKKFLLNKYLRRKNRIDIELLLDIVINDNKLSKIIKEYFQENQEKCLPDILETFCKADIDKKRLVAEILITMDSAKVKAYLDTFIKNDWHSLSYNTKLVLLEMIEQLPGKTEEFLPLCYKLLNEQKLDSWLRYQSLRTIFSLSKDRKYLLSLLKELENDRDELIKLEVKGLIKELHNNKLN